MSALWDTIDLHNHGIIEAHAGTGKTYTIVNLVLRILEQTHTGEDGGERQIHLRELLLVTYTEKAAGELKKRIREGLRDRISKLPDDSPLKQHLENCLNNLHEAFIGTIHSVCLRLLRAWPFESGVHFATEIVDDSEGTGSALRESMRTDWQNEATGIPRAFESMLETDTPFKATYVDLIQKIAVELLDDRFTALDRSATGDRTLRDLQREQAELDTFLGANQSVFNDVVGQLVLILEKALATGEVPPDKKDLCRRRISHINNMISTGVYDTKVLGSPHSVGRTRLLSEAKKKRGVCVDALLACAEEIQGHQYYRALDRKNKLSSLVPLALVGDAAVLVARRWQETKREGGLLSYKDMLRVMYHAVSEKPLFVSYLRSKLRYAIIDEFQDTSRLQWEVFKKLFVDSGQSAAPRLYIVGDPKQSIYAFGGADVSSYIDARSLLTEHGGRLYSLTYNFRSLAATVAGYNEVFAADSEDDNWFLFDSESEGIQYRRRAAVTTPERANAPTYALPIPPVQVIPLEISSPVPPMKQMADASCKAIEKMMGMRISIPQGLDWRDCTLEYGDFAVIVERHADAVPFLDAFRKKGIPAVKYKMEGVFQSTMALALHALLVAVIKPSGDPSPRLALLLTPFFNRRPDAIDPENDLEPCGTTQCTGDNACIAHALDEWATLAAHGLWAQLFDRIQRRTGVRERLLHLQDGERHLADLRQLVDYCLERLYEGNGALSLLAEELHHLFTGEKKAAEDRNLHVLETEKSCVRVLTMHAAKGLEFPVVFVASGCTKNIPRPPGYIRYAAPASETERGSASVLIAPFLKKDHLGDYGIDTVFLRQEYQERRRLLYVALTRVQSVLFLPFYSTKIAYTEQGEVDWAQCTLPEKGGDNDLTRRLADLLHTGTSATGITEFNPDAFYKNHTPESSLSSHDVTVPAEDHIPDIRGLKLLSRVCRQTSYSHLSRHAHTSREVDKSDEVDSSGADTFQGATPSPLPGSHLTGDALHCAIEELLRAENLPAELADEDRMGQMLYRYLNRNGIVARIKRTSGGSEDAVHSAVEAAGNCVKGALTTGLTLPGSGISVSIASLERPHRIPEMEFMLQAGAQWVHGFMDVVFRVENPENTAHPWRYFVLDWKSDTLPQYSMAAITKCIHDRHYYLQSRLYSHALDRYLHGVLGARYRPEHHLGGAVYLFLREQESSPKKKATVWSYEALPEEDSRFVMQTIREAYK